MTRGHLKRVVTTGKAPAPMVIQLWNLANGRDCVGTVVRRLDGWQWTCNQCDEPAVARKPSGEPTAAAGVVPDIWPDAPRGLFLELDDDADELLLRASVAAERLLMHLVEVHDINAPVVT